MTLNRMLAGSGLVALAAATGALVVPVAAANPPGYCEPGEGVTVIVDYGTLGGGVEAGCDQDGADVVASTVVPRAGFSLTYVQGQGFVCKINGEPAAQTCAQTPPADAYWAIFHSNSSGGWTYSQRGITSLRVPEGASIAFRWQHNDSRTLPAVSPNPAAEPSPTPTVRPTPTKRPTTPAPTPRPSNPGAPSAPQPSATPSADPSDQPSATPRVNETASPLASESAKAPGSASALPSTASTSPPADAEADVTVRAVDPATNKPEGEGNSLVSYVAGGLAVASLASAAVLTARRRRP